MGVVVRRLGVVETIEEGALRGGADVDVAQEGLGEEALEDGLVALEKLVNQRFGVFVGVVLGLDLVLFADIERHQVERHLLVVLAELYGLHGFAHEGGIVEEETLPCKDGVGLQVEVVHDVGVGIDVVLAAADHLLLTGFQVVEDGGVVGELGVDGQCLYRHADGVLELRVGAAVEDGGEEGFLLVVVLGQQERIGRREEGAFFYAVGLAEGIDSVHVGGEGAELLAVRLFGDFQVGHELGEGVAAVEVLGIPLFGLLEGGCLAHLGFGQGIFLHRHLLGSQRVAVVGFLHIANDNMIGGAVADDMVHVEEPIDMLGVAHHLCVKQPSAIEMERLDEFLLLGLNIGDLFDGKSEFLIFQIYGLDGFAFLVEFDAGEESGVGLYGGLNGATETVGIDAAVEDIKKGKVIEYLIFMLYAFGIDAQLRF